MAWKINFLVVAQTEGTESSPHGSKNNYCTRWNEAKGQSKKALNKSKESTPSADNSGLLSAKWWWVLNLISFYQSDHFCASHRCRFQILTSDRRNPKKKGGALLGTLILWNRDRLNAITKRTTGAYLHSDLWTRWLWYNSRYYESSTFSNLLRVKTPVIHNLSKLIITHSDVSKLNTFHVPHVHFSDTSKVNQHWLDISSTN